MNQESTPLTLPRQPAFVHPLRRPGRGLPIEIAFLEAQGVPRATLEEVARTAARTEVTADRVLLAGGLMTAAHFYESLARHLGVAYMRDPLPLAGGVRLDEAMKAEIAALAPNPAGLAYVAAPRGDTLVRLLRRFGQEGARGRGDVAITSPQRLAALVRLRYRRAIVHEASHGLPDWNENLSARSNPTLRQKTCAMLVGAMASFGAGFAPEATFAATCLLFSALFLAAVTIRLLACAWSREPPEPPVSRLPEADLPVYTVVVPLYQESAVVPGLMKALRGLDYPPARLDIKMVVEANDRTTMEALQAEDLPDHFEILMAPPGRPQTKPRALNVALQFARGRFFVVFDAEDHPEPGQLRIALAHFDRAPANVACLQARLAIDNGADSWLSRLFALEYAALFDVINPGLARLGLPIPLGGTSNHFRIEALRRVNGWDAWNVTEDIDLGIRLARFGYRTGVLPSSTFEEAPNRVAAWLGQRRRWQKGWMVTLKTHSRDPGRLFADLGLPGGAAVFAILCGTIASSLLGPLFTTLLLLDAAFGPLLAPRTPGEAAWSGLAATLVVLGTISLAWPMVLGLRRRKARWEVSAALALPLYLGLLSLATWQALFETMGRPYVWTKTEHGTARQRVRPG